MFLIKNEFSSIFLYDHLTLFVNQKSVFLIIYQKACLENEMIAIKKKLIQYLTLSM